MKYILNTSNMSVEACGLKVRRNGYLGVESNDAEKVDAFLKHSWIAALVKEGKISVADSVPDSMKSQSEQLASALMKASDAEKENATLKAQALEELKKRDEQIAALQAQLAALKSGK